MYTPVFPLGNDPARIAYGIERVLAQAIPTPTIEISSTYLSCTTPTESNPNPPHSRQKLCVTLRPNCRAKNGSTNENPKHTSEYIPKQIPAHSTPAVYSGDTVSGAPNTFRATATGKYSHMQNNPIHVQICTHASCRMVRGISRIDFNISRAPAPSPCAAAFCFSNSAKLSGGYSFVVNTVHNTAPKDAAAPM